jgi:hypothetical protein
MKSMKMIGHKSKLVISAQHHDVPEKTREGQKEFQLRIGNIRQYMTDTLALVSECYKIATNGY